MKRCSTCNKTFSDPKLSYCVDDGTPLVEVTDDDDELTQVGTQTSWKPPAYQPPSYVPPGGNTNQGRSRTWLGVVVGLLVVMFVGVTIAVVVYFPRLKRQIQESAANSNGNSSVDTNTNSSNASTETNTEENAATNAPPPTDKDLVLAQLKDIEQEWTVANLNADKKKLAKILADDYVGPTEDGRIQGKAEYIKTVERNTDVQKWEFADLRLTLHGDRATLLGKVRYQLPNEKVGYDFVDRFVWREGRWQATGSEVTRTQ